MSDIGFDGLFAALVGVGMAGIALLGLLVVVVRIAMGKTSRAAWLGPVAYGGLSVAILLTAEHGDLSAKGTADAVAVPVAAVGLLAWIGLHVYLRRRQTASDNGPDGVTT